MKSKAGGWKECEVQCQVQGQLSGSEAMDKKKFEKVERALVWVKFGAKVRTSD